MAGIPSYEYLVVSFFYFMLTILSFICLILVVTPKNVSISLQRSMFILLTLHTSVRFAQNIFDFIEKLEGFDLTKQTNVIIMYTNNSCDLFAGFAWFCAYCLLISFWACQYFVHKKQLNNHPSTLLKNKLPNNKKYLEANEDGISMYIEDEDEEEKEEVIGEAALTDVTISIPKQKVKKRKRKKKRVRVGTSSREIEQYSKRIQKIVSAIYAIISIVSFLVCFSFVLIFIIFNLKTSDPVFQFGRLFVRIYMTLVILIGTSYFGIALFYIYRKKYLSVGGRLKGVAFVTIFSLIIFIIIMTFNIFTAIFYKQYREDKFGVKFLIFLFLSLLEMSSVLFLIITLRPIQINTCFINISSFINSLRTGSIRNKSPRDVLKQASDVYENIEPNYELDLTGNVITKEHGVITLDLDPVQQVQEATGNLMDIIDQKHSVFDLEYGEDESKHNIDEFDESYELNANENENSNKFENKENTHKNIDENLNENEILNSNENEIKVNEEKQIESEISQTGENIPY